MKYKLFLFLSLTLFFACDKAAETQTVKIGGRYQIDLPAQMEEAKGLNKDASLQYQNPVKELYAIVIDESKSALEESIFDNNLEDTYTNDLTGYTKLVTENIRNNAAISKLPPLLPAKINNLHAFMLDITGSMNGLKIYWKIAYIEGKNRYYQVMVWTLAENREKYEPVMAAAINSFKETDRSGAH